jgi:hypothetical protein
VFVALAASVALAAAVDVARGVRVARAVAVGGTRVSVAGTGEVVRVAEGCTVAVAGTAVLATVLTGVLTAAGAPQAARRVAARHRASHASKFDVVRGTRLVKRCS